MVTLPDDARGLVDSPSVVYPRFAAGTSRGLASSDSLVGSLVSPGTLFDAVGLTDAGSGLSLLGAGTSRRGLADSMTGTVLGVHSPHVVFDDLLTLSDSGQTSGWAESFDDPRGIQDGLSSSSPAAMAAPLARVPTRATASAETGRVLITASTMRVAASGAGTKVGVSAEMVTAVVTAESGGVATGSAVE